MKRFTAAVCQPDTQENKKDNLRQLEELLREAKEKGAKLAALPEVCNVIDPGISEPECIPNGETTRFLQSCARKLGLWILCGSILERCEDGKTRNTSCLIDPEGKLTARYSKLHMFDVDLPDGSRAWESELVTPGEHITLAETPLAKCGLAICYDLRFPELFRLLALKGAEVLFLPAEFNLYTGRMHWETLLRARAIENQCFVIAPGQCGVKNTRQGPYPCYGNSMIIAPDGEILCRLGDTPGVAVAELQPERLEHLRNSMPVLKNRRSDVYRLTECGQAPEK